jgi:hypothetical protein
MIDDFARGFAAVARHEEASGDLDARAHEMATLGFRPLHHAVAIFGHGERQ